MLSWLSTLAYYSESFRGICIVNCQTTECVQQFGDNPVNVGQIKILGGWHGWQFHSPSL